MLETTIQIIKSGLKADPSVTPHDRAKIIAAVRNGPDAEKPDRDQARKQALPRIVRRSEAAQMYGCSLRLIDRLAEQGVLRKIRLPGRQRGAGFLESDLLAVIAGKEVV